MLVMLVFAGYGISIAAAAQLEAIGVDDLMLRPLRDAPAEVNTWLMMRDKTPSEPLSRFIEVLIRLGARKGRHALHEIEDRFRRAAFLLQHGIDDLSRLGLAEAALAQEGFAVLVNAGDDPLARRPGACTKGAGEEWAKLVSAGAASWAKRCAANLLCWMLISSKPSTPQRLRFMHTARR